MTLFYINIKFEEQQNKLIYQMQDHLYKFYILTKYHIDLIFTCYFYLIAFYAQHSTRKSTLKSFQIN